MAGSSGTADSTKVWFIYFHQMQNIIGWTVLGLNSWQNFEGFENYFGGKLTGFVIGWFCGNFSPCISIFVLIISFTGDLKNQI